MVSLARVFIFERLHQKCLIPGKYFDSRRATRARDRVPPAPHLKYAKYMRDVRSSIETRARGARESGERETTDTAFDSVKGGLVG